MAEQDKDEEEKGCCTIITDFFGMIFAGIFWTIKYICDGIVWTIKRIVDCLSFVWYPIKERIGACCNWCRNRGQRSMDPTYSTFDNEM